MLSEFFYVKIFQKKFIKEF